MNQQTHTIRAFYQLPMELFTDPALNDLSADAKILYSLMVSRHALSRKNGWHDKQGQIYLVFCVHEIQKKLNCGKNKALKLLRELEAHELLRREKRRFGQADLLYLPRLNEALPAGEQTAEEAAPSPIEPAPQQVETHPETTGTANDKPAAVQQTPAQAAKRNREDTIDLLKENWDYDWLCGLYPDDRDTIDEWLLLSAEVLTGRRQTIRVGKEDRAAWLVKQRLLSLTDVHISYLLDTLSQNQTRVRNIKQYLLTALYNAPATCTNYYKAAVRHDYGVKKPASSP